jgi:hypothetical protein
MVVVRRQQGEPKAVPSVTGAEQAIRLPRKPVRRSAASTILSVSLHVALGAVFVRAILLPATFRGFIGFERTAPPAAEHITFVTPAPLSPPAQPARSGGDGRPAGKTPTTPAPPIIAPSQVPSGIPTPAPGKTAPVTTDEGSGPIVGSGGPAKGVRPSYTDPHIWSAPSLPPDREPRTSSQRMDSVVAGSVARHNDSLALYGYTPNKFERGDWTVEKDGKKYGIDQQYIRLGKFSLPLPLLALLPLNVQGNPNALERDKRLAAMHTEIFEHAQQAMNEEEFRKAVKNLRERKDREKKAQKPDTKTIAAPDGSR